MRQVVTHTDDEGSGSSALSETSFWGEGEKANDPGQPLFPSSCRQIITCFRRMTPTLHALDLGAVYLAVGTNDEDRVNRL